MINREFRYEQKWVDSCIFESQLEKKEDRNILKTVVKEWNDCMCVSELNKSWKKERPISEVHKLNILLYNVEGLNTHIADVDVLIAKQMPHICALTGIGDAVRNMPR